MPQLQTITFTTPTLGTPHTLSPRKSNNGETVNFVDVASPHTGLLRPTVAVNISLASSKRATDRFSLSASMPEVATINGIPTVLSTARYAGGVFIFPHTWNASQRLEFYEFVAAAQSSPIVSDAWKNSEGYF